MNKSFVAGGIAVVAVFAGVVYFASRDGAEQAAIPPNTELGAQAVAGPVDSLAGSNGAVAPDAAVKQAVATDPRLAQLAVSPDSGMIEFIKGPDGKVIKEIDKDPASPGFGKTLREYTYRGDQVVALVSHKYLGDQVQTTRVAVAYKSDGSIDQYQEATSYDYGKKGKPQG